MENNLLGDNQMENNNSLLELSSDSFSKLEEVLDSDSVKQLLSDSKSLENLTATILESETSKTDVSNDISNNFSGSNSLVNKFDSIVNKSTYQNKQELKMNYESSSNVTDFNLCEKKNFQILNSFENDHIVIEKIFYEHSYSMPSKNVNSVNPCKVQISNTNNNNSNLINQEIDLNELQTLNFSNENKLSVEKHVLNESNLIKVSTELPFIENNETNADKFIINKEPVQNKIKLNSSDNTISEKMNTFDKKEECLQTPQRRSQRQIEKIERSVLEKIKAENQELLKKELDQQQSTSEDIREEKKAKTDSSSQESDSELKNVIDSNFKKNNKRRSKNLNEENEISKQAKKKFNVTKVHQKTAKQQCLRKEEVIVSNRPQRQRKIPKRWEDTELEVNLNLSSVESEKKLEKPKSENENKNFNKIENKILNINESLNESKNEVENKNENKIENKIEIEIENKLENHNENEKEVENKEENKIKTKIESDLNNNNNSDLNKEQIKLVNNDKKVEKKQKLVIDDTKNNKKTDDKKKENSSSSEDNEEDSGDDWNSDDDPDKLWCTCRKPHDNRFMISCDLCKEWFHGSCVGVTQAQGTSYEKMGKKWFCVKCREEMENERKLIRKPITKEKQTIKKTFPYSESNTNEKRKSSEIEIKKPNEFVNKEKLKFNKSHENKKEEQKLKDLIKNKKIEFNKKLSSPHVVKLNENSNTSNNSSLSSDEKFNISSTNQTHTPVKSKTPELSSKVSSLSKEEKKKRHSSASLDPTFNDLFKAELVTIQKKNSSLNLISSNSSNKRQVSSNDSQSICIYSECKKPCQKINNKEGSVYCSKECIEKHVKESITLLKQIRLSNAKTKIEKKSAKYEEKRLTLVEKRTGRYLTGSNAIPEDKILDYIKNNPSYEIITPLSRKSSSNDEKTITDNHRKLNSSNLIKEKTKLEENKPKLVESSSENIRQNARKTLRKTFLRRLGNCKDFKMEKEEVKKIASKIEHELFNYFKEINHKYKNRYRSLVFNLSDVKNEGLFRKVLTGKLLPEKLVRMSSEELASTELAKWRERENKHSIEMLKRDAEQQASQVIVKKTHKGEEMIETKVQLPSFDEPKKVEVVVKTETNLKQVQPAVVSKVVSTKDKPFSSNTLDILFKDTTNEHGQHLFDLHCKICTNQTKEDLSLVHKPKQSTVKKNVLNAENVKITEDVNEKLKKEFSIIKNEVSPKFKEETLKINALSGHQTTPNTTSNKSNFCWNGFINMQDVAQFVAYAYKVSGNLDPQDILESIQVCGRIAPEQVFYYLDKLKSTSRNEIIILKFIPGNNDEKIGYEAFFHYLNQRKRLGVISNSGKTIKDFYILPLAKDQNVPEVLLPFDGIDLEKKHHRPNILLGILVKSRKYSIDTKIEEKPNQTPPLNKTKTKLSKNDNQKKVDIKTVDVERSYTPPPQTFSRSFEENSNSNSNSNLEELSFTPTRKFPNQQDEPYDPEQVVEDLPKKKQKLERNNNLLKSNINNHKEDNSPTKNLANLLQYLTKNKKNENGLTSAILGKIAKTTSVKEQQMLLDELKQKVEDSKKELEIQRKAAENAFNVATGSGYNFDSNVIPGLDGDFAGSNDKTSFDFPKDLHIPEELKEILETVDTNDKKIKKPSNFDDPIVKNFGGEIEMDWLLYDDVNKCNNQEKDDKGPEPMELDDEEEQLKNTILEVNNLRPKHLDPRIKNKEIQESSSETNLEKKVSQLADDELVRKAQAQLEALKEMEKEQEKLKFAQQQAMAIVNQNKS